MAENQICKLLQKINCKIDKNHSDLAFQLQSELNQTFISNFYQFDDKKANVKSGLQIQSNRVLNRLWRKITERNG